VTLPMRDRSDRDVRHARAVRFRVEADMEAVPAELMSRGSEQNDVRDPRGVAASARGWSQWLGDASAFALVGVALVGAVFESLDIATDNRRGVLFVAAGAASGALASAVYGRIETNRERIARARVVAWNIVRYFVAFELMRYGVAKLVGMQFYPRYYRLDTRAADLSPMALAWTFFGREYGYQAATGALEVLGALLLCFRRTSTFGACLLVAVMTNIVLVDFFYDVPVKLFSSVYLLMALFVLTPDARRLWAIFTTEGPAPARALPAAVTPRRWTRMATAFVVTLIVILPSADIVRKAHERGIFRTDALEGAWIVRTQTGIDLPSAGGTWEKVYFEKGAYGFIAVGGERVPFKTEIDERAKTLRLFDIGGSPDVRPVEARYDLDGRRLHVDGANDGAPFVLELTRDLPP